MTGTSRPSSSTPAPYGPPSLCPVSVSASTPDAAKSTGRIPTACTASVCIGTPCRCATAASSRIGLTVPTSLLAHITDTTAADPGSCGERGGQGLGLDPAVAVDGQHLDLRALVLGEPPRGVEDGVVLDRGDEHAAAAVVGGRGAPSRGP